MFVLLSRYLKPLDEVDKVLAEHRAFLEKHYASGDLLISGPQNPRTGGVIVTKEMTRDAVEAMLASDPFVREGVSEYQIIEFNPTRPINA
jgi:uncharacterized protein YciI